MVWCVCKKHKGCCKKSDTTINLEEGFDLNQKEDAKPQQEEEGPKETHLEEGSNLNQKEDANPQQEEEGPTEALLRSSKETYL